MIKRKAGSGNKVAIYARYSSDNQRDESIDAQIRAVRKYCAEEGFVVVKEYIDRAKSATTDRRPEFQRMVTDSALDLFDVVMVHKLDRFSRDRYDSAIYKRKLRRNGVMVFSVTERLDDSPESVMMESVLSGMAEYYSKNLAREVRKGMQESALQCRHTGGTPPLGYDVDPVTKKYVLNEAEAMAVRDIFRFYNEGCGYEKIMNILNAKGYKTKKGKPFGKNSLHEILANEKYSGVFIYNRSSSKTFDGTRNNHIPKKDEDIIRIEGGVPAIIEKDAFRQAKQRMEANRHQAGSYKAKENYLLSGLVFCGECGHAMSGNRRFGGSHKTKYVSYKCCYRENNRACTNKEIRKEYLEGFVLSELERMIFHEEAIPRLLAMLNDYKAKKTASDTRDTEVMQARLADINKQIQNIVNAIASGYMQPEFKEKMTELDEQKAICETQLFEIHVPEERTVVTEPMLRKMIGMFRDFVQAKNIPECKKFIQSFVKRVVVFHDRVEVTMRLAITPAQGDSLILHSEEDTKTIQGKYSVA